MPAVDAPLEGAGSGAGALEATGTAGRPRRPWSRTAMWVVSPALVLGTCLPLAGDRPYQRTTASEVEQEDARPYDLARTSAAWTSRLDGAADAYATKAAEDALALAEAAVDASLAASTVDGPVGDAQLRQRLGQAHEQLARLTAARKGPRLPAGVPVRGARVVDDATTQGSVDLRRELSSAATLSAAAQEAFGIVLELELAAQEAEAAERAEKLESLERLESLAASAVGLAERAPGRNGEGASGPVRTVSSDLDLPYPNGKIPLDQLCSIDFAPGHLLQCEAAAALERLAAAYRLDTGRPLRLTDSYRSYEAQVAVKRKKGWLAATPGRSVHGLGLAVDIADMGGLGQFNAPAYLWMKRNAPAFGWHHPTGMEPGGSGPPEPWHWEYRGR